MHKHRAQSTDVRPFFGPVAKEENRAAHGGICERQTCSCGAVREVNSNGRHVERGEWSDPIAKPRNLSFTDADWSEIRADAAREGARLGRTVSASEYIRIAVAEKRQRDGKQSR